MQARAPPLVRDLEMRRPGFSQRYTQLDPHRYRYESASGFSADLLVDELELGLVTWYSSGWEQAATL
jgi:hypothetical protein